MYSTISRLLFKLEPEKAHTLTLQLIRFAALVPGIREAMQRFFQAPALPVKALGLTFKNPVGLAAGYDKDGLAWRGLALLGFGHIEVGSVTPQAQPGNPSPRLFRLIEDQALINRMGFPSRGADYVAARLRQRDGSIVLGVNLGVNRNTPLEQAKSDYLSLLRIFAPLADFLVVNVSSPNTTGLRRLQTRRALEDLLTDMVVERAKIQPGLERPVPILVKLAPDLNSIELDDALQAVLSTGVEGIIATNTTINRNGLRSPLARENGGLSGAPLDRRSTEVIREICRRTDGKLPVIGVGGIMSVEQAREKIQAGASLIQIYTGLVYAGPGLVKNILIGLSSSEYK